MGYDLVPITGSSLGLTIDSAATLLFACFINRLPYDFLFFDVLDFVHVLFHSYFV